MEILPTFQLTPTYVSARLSMKIKNYNLLSSVTLSGVIDWIWIINEVTEVGDGSVTANFAVTLPFFNGYLWAVGWAIQSFLVSPACNFCFSCLELKFHRLETLVPKPWNQSFGRMKTVVPADGISETRQELMPYLYDSINLTAPTVRLTCSSKKQ